MTGNDHSQNIVLYKNKDIVLNRLRQNEATGAIADYYGVDENTLYNWKKEMGLIPKYTLGCKWLTENQDGIIRLLNKLEPKTIIVKKYHCSINTLNRWLKKNKVTIVKPKLFDLQGKNIREYLNNHTVNETSRYYNISTTSLYDYIKKHKINYLTKVPACEKHQDTIINNVKQGRIIKDIAIDLSISTNTVWKVLTKNGIKTPPKESRLLKYKEDICKQLEDNTPKRIIAKKYHVAPYTLKRFLTKNKIKYKDDRYRGKTKKCIDYEELILEKIKEKKTIPEIAKELDIRYHALYKWRKIKIKKLYASGVSFNTLKAQFNMPEFLLNKWVEKHFVYGNSRLDPFRNEIAQLMNNNTTTEIAQKYRVTFATMREWMISRRLKKETYEK